MNAYTAQIKRVTGVKFVVIETATGKRVGDGKGMPYSFAKYVRDVRDTFGEGAYLVKRI